MSLLSPRRRLLRRPDLRHLAQPRPSGQPLTPDEIDYDDLVIHRTWRAYDEANPDAVRYMMYQLSQRDPGGDDYTHFWKAVRFVRVTRVPRYLRQTHGGDGAGHIFEAERDMLAALREQQVLFVHLIAKAPSMPLVFAYGVQAVGETPEAAQAKADESYAVLAGQLDGTFQQLEYKPLSVDEGEQLARYQREWNHIAMARGRPLPTGLGHAGTASWLNGNRTMVESTANQLESFIRGMSDKSFMMSLVTAPVSPMEMTVAWRAVSKRLSRVRSDQQGSRSVTAGMALPIALGMTDGTSHGTTHASGATQGIGLAESAQMSEQATQTLSATQGEAFTAQESVTQGESFQQTAGTSESVADQQTHGMSAGQSASVGESAGVGVSAQESATVADSVQESVSEGRTVGMTETASSGLSVGESASQSLQQSQQESVTEGRTVGVSEQQGVSQQQSAQESATSSASEQASASASHTEGATSGRTDQQSQTVGQSHSEQAGVSDQESVSEGSRLGAGLPGFSGGFNEGESFSFGQSLSETHGLSSSLTGGTSLTEQFSESISETFGQTLGLTESIGQTIGETFGASAQVGSSEQASATSGLTVGESAGLTQGTSVTESAQVGQSASETSSLQQALAAGRTVGQGLTVGESAQQGVQASQGVSQQESVSQGRTVGAAASQSQSAGVTASQSQAAGQSVQSSQGVSAARGVGTSMGQTASEQAGASDTYMAAASRTTQQSGQFGPVPSIGYTMSRMSYNESARTVGDFIESQARRYQEGMQSGAYLYQLFLTAPDRDTLVAGSGLLKSAFWGTGGRDQHTPQPFSVFDTFDRDGEDQRLLDHAAAFTSYRRREPRVELMEPWLYSTIITPTEAAAFSHPPTAESIGLLAVHDSMPVFAMPSDRSNRDIHLGHLINGERARVENQRIGVNLDELTHTLMAGTTGSGKTTTMLRLVTEAVRTTRRVVQPDPEDRSRVREREVPAGALCLDWMSNFRQLANVVEPERFRFYSLAKPELGQFRFNLLAVPDDTYDPHEWLNTVADLFMVSYGLGEFARSIIWEHLSELYAANRLEPVTLRPAQHDAAGNETQAAVTLPPVDPNTLPPGSLTTGSEGQLVANVFSCPSLSRLISLEHLAVKIAAEIESLAQGRSTRGSDYPNRLQTVWRRLQYFAPGGSLSSIFAADERLDEPQALQPTDLIDPERGLVTVIETDGLDYPNRRLVLGGVLMATWRYGQHHGEGTFNQSGQGPGSLVVLEEAHELFGSQGDGEDRASAATRSAIYESMFRRARALGLLLVAVVQDPADVPTAITNNTPTVLTHRIYGDANRQVIAGLMNWERAIGQHYREVRYLGEMPVGYCIMRLHAREHFLESAPIHFRTDAQEFSAVTDAHLAKHRRRLESRGLR